MFPIICISTPLKVRSKRTFLAINCRTKIFLVSCRTIYIFFLLFFPRKDLTTIITLRHFPQFLSDFTLKKYIESPKMPIYVQVGLYFKPLRFIMTNRYIYFIKIKLSQNVSIIVNWLIIDLNQFIILFSKLFLGFFS